MTDRKGFGWLDENPSDWPEQDVPATGPRRCAVCNEQESNDPAWSGTHKYGPVEHGEFIPSEEENDDAR